MGNRFSFYFSQGSRNLKNSILIILGLSLALSMVSGISLFIDSYQSHLVNESFGQMLDFDVKYGYEVTSNNISQALKSYDSSVESLFLDAENLEIESTFQYFKLSSWDLTFYKNYTKEYGQEFGGIGVVERNDFRIGLFDEKFYISERFDKYFSIINGTFPKSDEEILISVDFAYKMNLTLGETTNLDIKASWVDDTINSTLSLSDVKVVGIYAGKFRSYSFSNTYLFNRYNYYSENNTVTGFESIVARSAEFVFCHINFSQPEQSHPVQILIYDYNLLKENSSLDAYVGTDIEKNMGLGICYNRDLISFNSLNSYSRKISQETYIIEIALPYSVIFRDYLSSNLSELYFISSISRVLLQILNLPILIFAIFIGSFAIKTNTKSRLDEFLLLRSKGSPNSLLRKQFLVEAFFNGVASSTVALIAGLGTFYGFRELLGDLLFMLSESEVVLIPRISWGTVILTYSIGIGITFLASLSSIVYVGKLPTHKLLTILGSDSMDIEYDEKSLFRKTEEKKVSIEETPFFEGSQDIQNASEIEKESRLKKIKKKRKKGKKHSLYQNAVQTKEKKKAKLSIAFIILSLFPLMVYILYYIGSLPSAPDIFIALSSSIMRYFLVIFIFAIISPVLFVVGIIRIIAIEKPSRFARISKFLSSIFLKEKSFICGMEMVKRKQYKTVILLVGIFTALLVFTNVFLNSFSRYDIIMNNLEVGSDFQGRINRETMNLTNTYDVELLEDQMLSYNNSENETMINDVLTCYREMAKNGYYVDIYHFDIEKYLDIIKEDGKKLPYNDYISQIKGLIDYNKDPSNEIPGVIVNTGFLYLNNLELGDSYTFDHGYFNSTSSGPELEDITVKILVATDVMPGLFLSSSQWGERDEIIISDIGSVNQDKNLLHGFEIFQMVDLDTDIEDERDVLIEILNNASINYIDYSNYEFYDQNWNDLNIQMELSESGIYGIIYLEFTMIGVLMGFGLAILILSFQRENKYFNGVLLARGFGRRGLLKLILSQISIIFLIGILTGLLSGFLTSFSFLQIAIVMNYGRGIISLPLFVNIGELVGILGIIVLSSFVIYLIAYYFESKKNITEYFHKF
jgi:hypothetical protein